MNTVLNSSKKRIYRVFAIAACSSILLFSTSITPSQADPLERGVQGAISGAIIGGIIDGGKGAGRGAVIGGAIGIIGGAVEEEEYRREYDDEYAYDDYPRKRYHDDSHDNNPHDFGQNDGN